MLNLIARSLIITLLFIQFANASPCSPEDIKHELIKMKLDPEIKTNKELLVGLNTVYGEILLNHLKSIHPLIEESPETVIDLDTLDWVDEIIWHKNNKFVTYVYIPGDLSTMTAMNYFILIMDGMVSSRSRTIPVFQYPESQEIYNHLLTEEFEAVVTDIFKSNYSEMDPDGIEYYTNKFLSHYRKYNDYLIGFDSLQGTKPVIQIIGHGKAGFPAYNLGEKDISVEEIVKNIVEMGIPIGSTIKLTGCFTACRSPNVPHTMEKIKKLFMKGKIKNIYDKGQVKSFLYLFNHELKRQLPAYSGEVRGYIGEVAHNIGKNVLTKSGETTSAFFVVVKALDGILHLKREEASMSYNSSTSTKDLQ